MDDDTQVSLGRTHPIHTIEDLLNPSDHTLANCISTRKAMIVVSPTVRRSFGESIDTYLDEHNLRCSVRQIDAPSGESSKTMDQVIQVLEHGADFGLRRRDVIIAVGGGICCDLVGLAATLYRRGVPHVKIPTTLLGIVDAGIGIKNGVNTTFGKNKVGAFRQPEATFIDAMFLETLPKSELLNGIAEIMKMGLVVDRAIFEILRSDGACLIAQRFMPTSAAAKDLINRSIVGMQIELSKDPNETGVLERAVDFGHTFSPLFETASGYRITHGEAVSMDMALSICIANKLQWISDEQRHTVLKTFRALGLRTDCADFSVDQRLEALREATCHRAGALALPLPFGEIGSCRFFMDRATLSPQMLAECDAVLRAYQ